MSSSDFDEPVDVEIDGFPVASPASQLRGRDPLEIVVSEFSEQKRQGRPVDIEHYVTIYPHLADEIRELLPMVEAMEKWKREKETDCLREGVPETMSLERLGDCRIVRELARGGMGIVFEAIQETVGRRVAVKLLPWRADYVPKWRERFRRETEIVKKLRHPNIVPLLGTGQYRGFAYFVMPFIEGVSLDWVVRRLREADGIVYSEEIVRLRATQGEKSSEAMPAMTRDEDVADEHKHRNLHRHSWQKFAIIGFQAAKALSYAHDRGIVHNDVKPGNLMLGSDGRVWVADFGLARPMEQSAESVDDSLAGTVRFMAPERFHGGGDDRSDIYSLGLTLYELITLRPAWNPGDRTELVQRILESKPVPPRDFNAAIPKSLEAIVLRAIERDPMDRYKNARDMANDLMRFINGERVEAVKRGIVGRLWGKLRGE